MLTLTRSASIRDRVSEWRHLGQRIALVPTRGTLHKGHMSLVAEAQDLADHVIVSLFADGSPGETPTLEADRELLTNVGAEILFVPPVQEMFPIGRELAAVVSLPEVYDVTKGGVSPDGGSRSQRSPPTLTVLTKLFNLIRPHVAVFGERDFPHHVMARRLVDDLFLPIEIVACPTFRDSDGLALATVNRHLTHNERAVAPLLHASLGEIAVGIDAGARDFEALERAAARCLDDAGFVTEYVAIRQAVDLAAVRPGARELVILAAVRLGEHRLTDSLRVALIDRF